ncbi:hypothetical protein TNCV_330201 [Trichonephila clavipes]|nr:hypothetical protein TNCV_330201 [Trichonephila clavipes]
MLSFLVLREWDNRNSWRDGQVCPDVGQGIMAPWARRPERKNRSPALDGKEKPCPGSRELERRALRRLEWKGRKDDEHPGATPPRYKAWQLK